MACCHRHQTITWANIDLPSIGFCGTHLRLISLALLKIWNCTWWRHQMETFSALLAICAGNSPVPGEFPTQRPVTQSFDVFFDLRLNKQLSKQSWGWWFDTLSGSLWRQCNGKIHLWDTSTSLWTMIQYLSLLQVPTSSMAPRCRKPWLAPSSCW